MTVKIVTYDPVTNLQGVGNDSDNLIDAILVLSIGTPDKASGNAQSFSLSGGNGGVANGLGGTVYLSAGDGGNPNGSGGNLFIDAGTGVGSGTNGAIYIGTASSINSGQGTTPWKHAGYFEISDMAAPANPGAGKGRLYKKTGNAGIFWKPDAAGAEVDLTSSVVNPVTATAVITDNAIVRGDGGTRSVQESGIIINDVSGATVILHTPNAVVDTNANDLNIQGGDGGNYSAVGAGQGGNIVNIAGQGGDGNGSNPSGDGGDAYLAGGAAGTDNGGGEGDGGNVHIDAGIGYTNGIIEIGVTNASAINSGSGSTPWTHDGNLAITGELKVKVFAQDNEPTLFGDNYLAIWKDTNDSDKIYLVFRRGTGDQVKVQLQ